ncbi:steryl-sulfatase-like [Ptychodera flava]|uniref:steryl-sulfatase-like n=1 Tax=Ptychodera flava TaxID=63121 RepID=UPI003969C0E3
MYPGVIPANTEVSEPTSVMDVFPTVLKLAGAPLPSDRIIDGRDLMPIMTKQVSVSEHEFMFHYCGIYLHAVRYRPRKGGSTYKIYYVTPNWTPGTEGCFDEFVCQCWAPHVTHHDQPLVYDLTIDPAERNQLGHGDPRYQEVVKVVGQAVQDHLAAREEVPVQYEYINLLWYPWLQPCCNFPLCYCKEEENITEYL